MAVVSDIEIRLRADIAQLRQDMNQARREVGGAMEDIRRVTNLAGNALKGLGGYFAVDAILGFAKSVLDATDAASDLSQKTGVALDQLAGLQLWFQKGGMEAGTLDAAMVKLSKNIAENGKDFAQLGINTKTANGELRANTAVLADAADKFAAMQDGTVKTALAVKLFGKTGADLIPMLNEGSEGLRAMTEMADKLGLTFDQKVVDQAGEFNDTLSFLGLAAQGVGRQVAAELLPTLQSMAGSFLEFIVKSDMVKKAASGIATAFKVVYTAGVSIVTLFSAVGKVIGGTMAFITNNLTTFFTAMKQGIEGDYAKAWQTIQNGAQGAGAILSGTFRDVKADLSAAATTITDVWTGAGGDTVAALTKIQKAGKYTSEEAAKDAKKQAEAYAAMMSAARELVASTQREADGLAPLNAAQKLNAELTSQLAEGKVKLTAVQEAGLRALYATAEANLAVVEAQKTYTDYMKEQVDLQKDLDKTRADAIKSATDEAEKNERLAKTFGMTATQIERVELARLKEQLAAKDSDNLNVSEIAHLEQLIALKERSAAAVASTEELEKAKQFWTDIDKTAHDTFVSIADGGKGAFQRLKDTAKNVFFDWLYQQTLKKWIVNIQADAVGGVAGTAGAASAAGGIGGIASAVKAVVPAVAAYMPLIASAVAAYAAGSAVAGGFKVGRTGLANFVNSFGIVGGLFNRAFGMRDKEATGTTLSGSIGAGGFAGSVDTAWKQEGGWFRGDKSGVEKAAVDAMTASGLTAAYDAIKAASADYAKVLGLNADSIASRAQAINIALGKDEAENQKAIAAFFGGVADTVAGEILPGIAQFQKTGESAAATLQRVAGGFQVVDAVLATLGTSSQQAFNAVGVASIAARERLLALSGGIESLGSQTQFFADNFLTRAEQIAPLQKQVNDQLAALGYAGLTTADQFKVAVLGLAQSGALATEAGAKTYAGLLAVAPGFKTVADYLAEIAGGAGLDALRTRADDAMSVLSRSVDAQKDVVAKAYAESMSQMEASLDTVSSAISRNGALSQALRGAMRGVDSPDQQAASRQAAGAQIAAALAIAKASGVLPSTDDLRDALSTISLDTGDQSATLADYQRSTARMNAQLEQLGDLTDDQVSTAERQLKAMQEQRDIARAANETELARLDGLLTYGQAQLDAANGINNSVLSVGTAMNEVLFAIRDIKAAGGGFVGQLTGYAPPLAGPVSTGVPMVASVPQSGTMGGSAAAMQAALDKMQQSMEAMQTSSAQTAQATQQFAGQFNSVSAGGNALLMEPA